VPIPLIKQEYRPEVKEVVERLLEDSRFEGYLTAYAEAVLDGSPSSQSDALNTLHILTKNRIGNVEADLIEEHFGGEGI